MALATTCPQCKTSFKVVPDQLKLRRGLVRCGVCQHVFSGIDHLRYVDDAARAAQRASRERGAAAAADAPGPREDTTAPARTRTAPTAAPAAPAPTPRDGLPPDPWAAAAAIAHERSLRDEVPDRTADGATAPPASPTAAPTNAPTNAPTAAPTNAPTNAPMAASLNAPADAPTGAPVPTTDAGGRDAGPRDARPPRSAPSRFAAAPMTRSHPRADLSAPADASPAAGTPTGARAAAPAEPDAARGVPTAPRGDRAAPAPAPALGAGAPAAARPALPAPDAPRVPLDDLLARPTAPWRPPVPGPGPQTLIGADEDLKTAFFLSDSSFGPLPGETSTVMPPTSIHRPGAHAEAVPRVHDEAPPAPDAPPQPSARPVPSNRGAQALPGLPLRPERGATIDERLDDVPPAFVPVPAAPPESGLEPEPAPRRAAPQSEPAVDYFSGTGRRSRSLGLALSPTAWIAAVALAALLALQAVVGWRDAIAARVPLVAPTLSVLLGPFGLEVGPPRELDALTIEGFELQAAGTPNTLTASAVLRNRSGHVVRYPAMELTLTDSAGVLIVRKVIPPDLYVGDPASIESGLAGRSERRLRLALQHDGLKPTGFAVALFYP